jgi:SpoVK/Ycf46/Vps4 family AAA+-type ATPase
MSREAADFGLPAPRGLLMVGVQGCGKSLMAKAIARAWSLPLVKLDVGRLFAGLVGSSEQNIRQAIRVAESVAPVVVWIDEIEKGFAGTGSSDRSDAGTAARVFGTFTTWLQEKKAPVFVVATANDISQLPPELLRKGRFDEIFFVDLPGLADREEIFNIHITARGRDPKSYDVAELAKTSAGFSGAEIEASVIAALHEAFAEGDALTNAGIVAALRETVPLSRLMGERVSALREWARSRARPAAEPE